MFARSGWGGCCVRGEGGAGVEDEFDHLAKSEEVAFLKLRYGDVDLTDQFDAMDIFVVESDAKSVVLEQGKDLFLLPVGAKCIALDFGFEALVVGFDDNEDIGQSAFSEAEIPCVGIGFVREDACASRGDLQEDGLRGSMGGVRKQDRKQPEDGKDQALGEDGHWGTPVGRSRARKAAGKATYHRDANGARQHRGSFWGDSCCGVW